MVPETRYARNDDAHLAYQVWGEGEHDLVFVLGFVSHLEVMWSHPTVAHFLGRLGSFARVISFDRRGTGLSDPVTVTHAPDLDTRMRDIAAVMNAAGSERAVLFGASEGGPAAVLFAATHPERTEALVLYGAMARSTQSDDHPWLATVDDFNQAAVEFLMPVWGQGVAVDVSAPFNGGRRRGCGVVRAPRAIRDKSRDDGVGRRDALRHRRPCRAPDDPGSNARAASTR